MSICRSLRKTTCIVSAVPAARAPAAAVSLVCADEAPQLAAIEALIRQTLRREEAPGFEAEHRVPQTSATGQIIKKPKTQEAQSAVGRAGYGADAQQKPRTKPAGKPATGSRKPAGKLAGGRGKRQP